MTDKNSTNIFDYATKELSQDAMICWLIAWAGQEVDDSDEESKALRDCGRRFVKALLKKRKPDLTLPEIDKVEIRQQDNSIDVLARINRKYVLLIEDKTTSGDHSDQLRRYYEAVRGGKTALKGVAEENLHPIYLKTGNQSGRKNQEIEGHQYGYRIFHRQDFLDVLETYKGQNATLVDFRDYLQDWEDQTNAFQEWRIGAEKKDRNGWSWRSWEGFCGFLEQHKTGLGIAGWNYVSNPSGGFLACWWDVGRYEVEDDSGYKMKIYLQIEVGPATGDTLEDRKLCLKLNSDRYGEERIPGEVREKLRRAIETADGQGHYELARLGKLGYSMTLAKWNRGGEDGWLAFGNDGKLDGDATVGNLKQAEEFLVGAIAQVPGIKRVDE